MVARRAIALDQPPEDPRSVRRGKFVLGPNGLAATGPVGYDEWAPLGAELALWDRAAPFCIGDWANLGDDKFGEESAQAIDVSLGLSEATIRVYRWVAKSIAPADRWIDRGLDFKHHQLVAKLTPRLQRQWLKRAWNDGDPWTTARLNAALLAGDDLPVVDWLLLVRCGTEERQRDVMARLEGEGLTCTIVLKRQRKPRATKRAKTAA